MELLLGHEKIITKSGISLNEGTLNQGFTVYFFIFENLLHMYAEFVLFAAILTHYYQYLRVQAFCQ
jgi:cytochrome b subunit of formate dehydrogenase